jgi:hypothetical protein
MHIYKIYEIYKISIFILGLNYNILTTYFVAISFKMLGCHIFDYIFISLVEIIKLFLQNILFLKFQFPL